MRWSFTIVYHFIPFPFILQVSSLDASTKDAKTAAGAATEPTVALAAGGGGGGGWRGEERGRSTAHESQGLEQLLSNQSRAGRIVEDSDGSRVVLDQQRVEKVFASVSDEGDEEEEEDEEEVEGEEDVVEDEDEEEEEEEEEEDVEDEEEDLAGGKSIDYLAPGIGFNPVVLEGVDAKSVFLEDGTSEGGAASKNGSIESGVSEGAGMRGEIALQDVAEAVVDGGRGVDPYTLPSVDPKRPFMLRAFYRWTDEDDVRLANVAKRDFTVNS